MTSAALNACRARIESLESQLRIYRQALGGRNGHEFGPAFNRVSAQLEDAYLSLDLLEAELLAKKGLLR